MHTVAPSTRLHAYYFFQTWCKTIKNFTSKGDGFKGASPSSKLQAAKNVQVYARLYSNTTVTSSNEKFTMMPTIGKCNVAT